MKTWRISYIFITVCFAVFLSVLPVKALAYAAPVSTVRIGLNYGSSALPSANLQNVAGRGSGYEFGYYESNRIFIPLGAATSHEKITMMRDKNMLYNAMENKYEEGTEGAVVVGCFHIKLDTQYLTYAEARSAADTFTSVNAFVRYSSGVFFVMAGAYISAEIAQAEAALLGIQQSYTIDSGTSFTVTVVQTGTANILLEFDSGSSLSLAVRPLCSGGEVKPQTWFRYYKWYGDFQYSRLSGGDLTVVNFVNIEDYVKGVIPYEMNPSWPLEALKAQAVCARTYVTANLNKHRNYGFDCCNTTDCQVYYGNNSATANSDAAVDSTAGSFLTYNGNLCNTFYHAADGGYTENSENVWVEACGYLRAVEDIYETAIADSIPDYYWTITYSGEELSERLKSRGYSCSTIIAFDVIEYTAAGNVYKIRLTDSNGRSFTFTKGECRTLPAARSQRYTISSSNAKYDNMSLFVNSSNSTLPQKFSLSYLLGSSGLSKYFPSGDSVYAITGIGNIETVGEKNTVNPSNPTFVISGTGYGHNVGMSQRGAYAMAYNFNKTYAEILGFYFQGTSVVTSA